MKARKAAATLVAALFVYGGSGILVPSQARAETPQPLLKTLVLGDSYSAGVGGGDYEPGPCAVSPHSYAAQWVMTARQRGVNAAWPVNHACLGATMKHFGAKQNGDVSPQMEYVDST